jgi:hypothetical protein
MDEPTDCDYFYCGYGDSELIAASFHKSTGKSSENVMESTTAYNEKVSDLLNGHEVIKTYHAEGEMLPQFSASARHLEISREQLYQ